MIKYTNKFNYPQILYEAITKDAYDFKPTANSLSVTSLIRSPRIRKYTLDEKLIIEEDVSDMIWLLLGHAVHFILEQAGSNYIKELRIFKEFPDGIELSGKFDFYDYKNKILGDFKVTSKYNTEAKREWEEQLNVLKYLVENTLGVEVSKLQIIAIARDYMIKDKFSSQFADSPVVVIDIPVWERHRAELFIRSKLDKHKQYETYICTPEERWSKPDTFAVIKPGSSRALRVYDDEFEAIKHKEQLKDKRYIVEHRSSEDVFCKSYCPVRTVCEISKYNQ